MINYLESAKDAEYLTTVTPINKIPVLLVDGESIFESRVILNFLIQNHNLKKLTIEEENILSAIYAAIDVSVNLFMLKRGGLDLDRPNWYLQRQQERIPLLMKFILPWARNLDFNQIKDWNILSMSLYSYAHWGKARGFSNLQDDPELNAFLDQFKNAKKCYQME